jgi:porphobilinogen synthase
MDFRNSDEALREVAQDISEGADALIIKPAMCYLDIINRATQNFCVPIYGYQVSGEYAMLKLLAQHNSMNFNDLCFESLMAIKRAGACGVISYASLEIARFIADL